MVRLTYQQALISLADAYWTKASAKTYVNMFEGPVTGNIPEVLDNGEVTDGTHVTAGQLALALTPAAKPPVWDSGMGRTGLAFTAPPSGSSGGGQPGPGGPGGPDKGVSGGGASCRMLTWPRMGPRSRGWSSKGVMATSRSSGA